jgi:hypothetical protein
MSDEINFNESAFKAALNLPEPEPVDAPEPVDTPEPVEPVETPEPEPAPTNPDEDKARQKGWVSKSEWVSQGKDPDDWVSAKHFNEKGELISKARQGEALQRNYERDLENVKKYMQASAQMQIQRLQAENAALMEQKKQAIQYGDFEGVQKAENAMLQNVMAQQQLQQQTTQPAQGPSEAELAVEAQFERENQWINTQDPTDPNFAKAAFARNLYSHLLNTPGLDVNQRLERLQAEIAQKFPAPKPVNPNRDKAPVTDAKPAGKTSGELTWADLTQSELQEWNAFGHMMFPDKKAFLKAVKQSRG